MMQDRAVAVQHLSDFPSLERAVAEHLETRPDHTTSIVPVVGGNLARVQSSCGEKWLPGRHGPTADYARAGHFQF
jgi:hypothetical protein